MSLNELKEQFFAAVFPHRPNEWEVEEYLEELTDLPSDILPEIFKQVSIIWPVSHSLCYNFLMQTVASLSCLHPSQLADWVKATLDIYEEQGLRPAVSFMADVENNYLCRIRGETGLRYDEVAGRLLTYVRGISGRELNLAPGLETYTDTQTMYLPREIGLFPGSGDSFLLYKLIVTFQWALIACGTFADRGLPTSEVLRELFAPLTLKSDNATINLESFLAGFPEYDLARDLYHLLAGMRAGAWLGKRFPGLMRDCRVLLSKLMDMRAACSVDTAKGEIVEFLTRQLLANMIGDEMIPSESAYQSKALTIAKKVTEQGQDPMEGTTQLYFLIQTLEGGYAPVEPLTFQGVLKPAAVAAARARKREENKNKFVQGLAGILPVPGPAEKPDHADQEPVPGTFVEGQDAAALIIAREQNDQAPEEPDHHPAVFIRLEGRNIPLPPDMLPLVDEIVDDLGHVPSQYVSAAMQIAGRSPSGFAYQPSEEGGELSGPLVYDEWDFRRAGFRKKWCNLLQKDLTPISSTFMETTLTKYRPVLLRLKKEFEMLRTRERIVKRQRDGDDIDLDAVIDSLADNRAGLAPSEKLFIRLQRDERDIAAVFLVDMSSSTEGWVNRALKESLVLMSEALEVLGDRYAIYGFSGMRRLRSELYRIKHLDEHYSEEVKGRIAAIKPIDYTRMGPPIRHVTRMLDQVDARVRLLISLSDGKPEDYDDYKGDYAIEDTRHALIEAKAAGIHPFCITIDKKARDYIGHMYGEVNYIVIDNVNKLPVRIPEIYRTLTT